MSKLKQFELTIVRRDEKDIKTYDKIEGDSLVEVLSKFLLVIVKIQNDIHEELIKELESRSDDIPF